MGSRFSIRAQVAIALAFALVLGAALNVVISVALLRRAVELQSRRDLAGSARAVAGCVAACCPGRAEGCPGLIGATTASPGLSVRAVDDVSWALPSGAASAPLPGGGGIVVAAETTAQQGSVRSLLAAYVLLSTLLTFLLGAALLNRVVARPLDRLTAAADRIGRLELDDPFGGEAPTLGRLGVAFDRMALGLKEERERVSAQIAELERLNRQLGEARDSLARSEKLATVGRLAAGVAHEVGNPLGAILGYLELAKARAPEEIRDHLARIDKEVARIDRTVRELLDFSRPAPVDGAVTGVPLSVAVDGAVRLASVQKRLKQVAFDVEVPEGLAVVAEAHRLSQVLVNVLLNAGDAMKGEGRIAIRARRGEPDPSLARRASDPPPAARVELTIADSGPGIPAADLPRVFDPFFTTKEPGEGTGLGLSICHTILESFGGEIRAGNRPEGGAVFTLVFREAAACG